ncbi:uncharacterized protein C13orf42 homolog isoform X2 [Protopterus annectens]|uniref:uncharacterized protein C13orf42 homolog isoform X2 n=1 Tax=Protopterus annectens TaxID=7888 RepID=UPI001CFA56B3|nr:uncharacterized protein C13orf42 homolog isoform X2 [Protopterus annectens]
MFRSSTDLTLFNEKSSPVRLIRSTSMYIIGENQPKFSNTLKRSKSTVSFETSTGYHQTQEDEAWTFAKKQFCLQYLQDLISLRKKYLSNANNLKSKKADVPPVSSKSVKSGRPPPPPSSVQPIEPVQIPQGKCITHPNTAISDTLAFFDSVIADLDSTRPSRVCIPDFTNADVDFDVATSSAEHTIHSNWILRSPRRLSIDSTKSSKTESKSCRNVDIMTVPRIKRLERNPIYLPKVVEGAFNTIKFKPKPSKKKIF